MLNNFTQYITENNLFTPDDRILLGVSGGIDSMVMSRLFLEAGYTTGIAHCNFCLRGDDSDRDEEFVRNFAAENNIPFYSVRFDTKDYASEHGISIQMAARELRYKWFESRREENGFDFVAVAHNLDDNIETMIINLVRGTGISGLTGMKPASDRIVRPLLFASRQTITGYCNQKKISFREDRSNLETKYTRNKIRHLVIPLLKEINPSVGETLSETASRLSEIYELVTDYINDLRVRISRREDSTVIFRVNELREHLPSLSLLFELFRPYGITGPLAKDLVKILDGRSGTKIYTRSHRILRNRKELIITPAGDVPPVRFEIVRLNDLNHVPVITSADIIEVDSTFKIPDDRFTACLDLDEIVLPVKIRPWKEGDYFFPLGMNNRKKLSDYFIDRKYSLAKKEKVLVFESGGKIAWLIGERIDNRFRIKECTTRVLRIEATSG